MVDIHSHRIIDMIPSRELNDVTKWLRTYPNLKIVSRDGSITYKNAISQANPSIIQISDKFHLYQNLTKYCKGYLKKVFKTNVKILLSAQELKDKNTPLELCDSNRLLTLKEKYDKIIILKEQSLTQTQICKMLNLDIRVYKKLISLKKDELEEYFITMLEKCTNEKDELKLQVIKEVRALKEEGYSQRKIAKIIGISRQTVSKYLQKDFVPTHASRGSKKKSILAPYIKTINELLEQGVMVTKIDIIIRTHGYNGSPSTLRHYCSNWKKSKDNTTTIRSQNKQLYDVIPRTQILKLLFYTKDKIKTITERQFEILFDTYPALLKIYQLIRNFHDLFNKRSIKALHNWINEAKGLEIKEINSFINGIERDLLSVENAVIYEYNNGLAEGSINKLKVIKRIMYGRCNFNTLKQKVLKLEEFRHSSI